MAGNRNLGVGRSYLLGDANLDGAVDGLDFIAWNANKFQRDPIYDWTAGNFNSDSVVDGEDFLIWNAHKFTSSDANIIEHLTDANPWPLDEDAYWMPGEVDGQRPADLGVVRHRQAAGFKMGNQTITPSLPVSNNRVLSDPEQLFVAPGAKTVQLSSLRGAWSNNSMPRDHRRSANRSNVDVNFDELSSTRTANFGPIVPPRK